MPPPSKLMLQFEQRLTAKQRSLFRRLSSPARIQAFLDSIPYRSEEIYCSARGPLRDRQANCFDGALLAAAALRRLGHPPQLMQLVAERDDEHLLAVYRHGGHWGAVAKSNMVGLRYREPVYRSWRELAMSYFEVYFNLFGEKSLRGYTRPLDLRTFDSIDWLASDASSAAILRRLDELARVPLITAAMARRLSAADRRSYEAGMMGVNLAGLYVPPVPGPGRARVGRTAAAQRRRQRRSTGKASP